MLGFSSKALIYLSIIVHLFAESHKSTAVAAKANCNLCKLNDKKLKKIVGLTAAAEIVTSEKSLGGKAVMLEGPNSLNSSGPLIKL